MEMLTRVKPRLLPYMEMLFYFGMEASCYQSQHRNRLGINIGFSQEKARLVLTFALTRDISENNYMHSIEVEPEN
jgi:NOL1/NOP2/fmu family ribosome biogenesis protein